jgi:hypothetical protein
MSKRDDVVAKRKDLDTNQGRVVASYMDLKHLPMPKNLFDVITQKRLRVKGRTITRLFFAVLVKEGFTQDAEKHIVSWIEEKEREANRIKDEHRMREAGRERANEYMDDDRDFTEDVGYTGFMLVAGPVLVCFIESNKQI